MATTFTDERAAIETTVQLYIDGGDASPASLRTRRYQRRRGGGVPRLNGRTRLRDSHWLSRVAPGLPGHVAGESEDDEGIDPVEGCRLRR